MVAKKGFGQLFCHFSSFLEKNGPKEKDREVREEGERKRRRCHHGGTNKRGKIGLLSQSKLGG